MFNTSVKYGILGLARSGIAAAYKIKDLGGKAFLSELLPAEKIESSEALTRDFECEFGGHSDRLLELDTWIVSPGIPLNAPIIRKGRQKGIKLISEIEFGWQIKAPDSQVIAVTGSNGKSTTASLIYHVLKNSGRKCILAGNIGDAFCSFPIHKPGIEYIVLEISSFQLDIITSFAPHVAVLLNLSPDHLNRYKSFGDYCNSKMRIFRYQTAQDFAVLYLDSEEIVRRSDNLKAWKLYFSKEAKNAPAHLDGKFIHLGEYQMSIFELPIKGPHNHLNAMAALLCAQALEMDIPSVMQNMKSFQALPHRLEYVESVNGVNFYNDSKATNTDSVRCALESFDRPIRIILGGSDKGEDYAQITQNLQEHVIRAYITGESRYKMQQAWLGKVPMVLVDDFEDCIHMAFEEATIGENIVLSPACASYDKFKNFEQRGDTFKEIVRKLKREKEQA
ncbi:MAG: UDP-N-acetylmuramoyl-L-alanine--D-glutamate ligase [Candidatus Cloacimonetes bacterium]|nr:UDP-N-acetylmuramoyl-L-alanine--D-glutamate ligase [Candidatus Cloacimonadota bacterium]MDD4559558.1 UDP-N-acetylmuramoyl-L-alanine--D-glutamate ligase [Candidatus Cloacimonadota bacterium]